MAAGRDHTCARRSSGDIFCWGQNAPDRAITSACTNNILCRLPVQVQLSAQALDLWDQPALSSVFAVFFNISDADRVPGKSNVAVTFGFKPQTAINSGGSITLNYPAAFFAPDVTPSSAASSVQGLGFQLQPTSHASVVLVLDSALAATSSIIITLHGMDMGPSFPSAAGVSVQTSADVAISRAVSSGVIEGRVSSVAFSVATAHRIAGNSNATISVAFTPTSTIEDPQSVTMNYPHAFFSPGITPVFDASNTDLTHENFVFQPTSNTSLIFHVTGGVGLLAATPFVVTISGLAMGAATDGSPTGITVQTTPDTGLSTPVHSGPIFMSLVPVALSVFPPSPFVGEPVTVSGYSFILPDTTFNCSAKIGPDPSSGLPSSCVLLSSSRALVHLPRDAMISPSYVQLHFEPGNVTTTAATRLCPCSRVSGGTVCGCAADACAARL